MTTLLAPSLIDLSRVPVPAVIERLDYEAMLTDFVARFQDFWGAARLKDPTLPAYDVSSLQADPAIVLGQAWSYLRFLDRARVNDAIRSLLAPLAKGADLDNIAAAAGVERLVIVAAEPEAGIADVKESDESLLRRYLLAWDRPAAGSRDRYLYEAWTAWPLMGDVRVNGFGVHGRRGDIDIVIMGPGGRDPTPTERALVANAVNHDSVKPEAVAITVIFAVRAEYAVDLTIETSAGPDVALVVDDAEIRVAAVAAARTFIGGEIPTGLVPGSAYGSNVLAVTDNAPVAITADPYTAPVATAITITPQVRT